ncbi:MAG: 50S ribosomal protein L11 methyltransferase [Pseudomonadota bacterium]
MGWQQITLRVGDHDTDTIERVLLDAGAAALSYTDAADQPILEPQPGEVPLWADARLTALFPDTLAFEGIGLSLVGALGTLPELEVALLPEREWEREWLAHFAPRQFSDHFWVAPHEAKLDTQDGDVVLRLDPGLAFGTGTHATTALCLGRLAQLPLRDVEILDFGCGSGILAIAALLLGAAKAIGLDIDPQALTASRDNAHVNGVAERLSVALPPKDGAYTPAPLPLVVANILAGPLIALAPRISASVATGGTLLLSGILDAQAASVASAYEPWIEFAPIARQDGWVMLEGTRRDGV